MIKMSLKIRSCVSGGFQLYERSILNLKERRTSLRKAVFIATFVSLLVLVFVASAPAGSILDRILKKG
jgi:hypothetical protein